MVICFEYIHRLISFRVDSIDSKSGSDENECCVCMDRKALVELTCEHRYCEQCFDQWYVQLRKVRYSR